MDKEQAKSILKKVVNPDVKEAIETLIPELVESEDERIIETLYDYVKNRNWRLNGPSQKDCLAWLEKQKFSFKQIHESIVWDRGLRTGIELGKQKEASKAIEAIERIDKYIDKHVENAHDMKDSNPDKKYCQGIDDTLADIAGILQDVYSSEKQKEGEGYEAIPVESTLEYKLGFKAGKESEKQKETGIQWFKSDNVKNPDKPYIDKAGMFYTTDGRMCYASEIEKQKEQKPVERNEFYKLYTGPKDILAYVMHFVNLFKIRDYGKPECETCNRYDHIEGTGCFLDKCKLTGESTWIK